MTLRRWIQELLEIMKEENLAEIEVRRWFTTIRLRRPGADGVVMSAPVSHPAPTPASALAGSAAATTAAVADGPPASDAPSKNLIPIRSPMVGTFYRSPAPDADPYIEVNSPVDVGQTVCIVEAMKLMNEIESEVRGRIHQVLVENATPVEYGQVLFLVEVDRAA
ncbi:MAG TPA: acetyl-CoA carboxylase biotin carboxyl carrier protein [Candidatus Eisenbacteria bacterium]|nr:acetyl-CoA carboxylase biotin carboxyl carrier protein [Candidatus Eisenbacteria bacterium]